MSLYKFHTSCYIQLISQNYITRGGHVVIFLFPNKLPSLMQIAHFVSKQHIRFKKILYWKSPLIIRPHELTLLPYWYCPSYVIMEYHDRMPSSGITFIASVTKIDNLMSLTLKERAATNRLIETTKTETLRSADHSSKESYRISNRLCDL